MAVHCNTNPLQKSPERAFALQKYLLLHSQHDALQKHLSSISGSLEVPTEPSVSHHMRGRNSSLSLSPAAPHSGFPSASTSISPISETSDDFALSLPARPTLGRPRRSSLPATMSTFQLSQEQEVEREELKLMNVNQQIKTTLTELLNCDGMRGDERYRVWVMQRLMDVERELKVGRRGRDERRRSSAGSVSSDGM